MSATLPLPGREPGPRFPGFDVDDQAKHWDDATRAVIVDRTHALPAIRFFTPTEEACAAALFDQLMYQRYETGDDRIDIVRLVDQRLAENQTDGWHYDDLPPDGEAFRVSLAHLDEDAAERHGEALSELSWDDQHDVIDAFHSSDEKQWHGMPRERVWSLWTRYAATAFYSHPRLWNEIGFSGPAYPRGYKNSGLDKREPYEVKDAHPTDDALRGDAS